MKVDYAEGLIGPAYVRRGLPPLGANADDDPQHRHQAAYTQVSEEELRSDAHGSPFARSGSLLLRCLATADFLFGFGSGTSGDGSNFGIGEENRSILGAYETHAVALAFIRVGFWAARSTSSSMKS